ncbi:hypothetical protein [Legionella jordanis]|uniref:Uncharacterized protein n=1 Tax=Legionella jordanis TaxID=456 RepID=A0A0W0VBB2_9GAMM|nr:hypothetical protein [Legionella jordanis]KTD17393.1 hypothetical protein Ljor_1699 [Legionella jordanis]RMX01841.1 hypothetical protein EAW55_10060 [Legionella jordanis]RMX15505.1 hypothetical protein EAS68_12520 [Legionella jordanis]VEH11586.1 Uncharacterised protein [Legionella jordanis]HAT8714660.1 hypothetical protein [Legionella jordanis]
MDKTSKQRVLAYKKSTEISEEELGVVSGGSNAGMTHERSVKGTGQIGNADVRYDEVWDW